ncbi:hypothetical protein FPV67DRAFT_1198938 [Lyophyllum atratum]|nr:hypothetical protein FPV67DRAFT_1198938 [Lyophyllum atratum]
MSESARVWRIYNDEATNFDSSLTEGWNRGVDVLLVFTGLFSAVLTTFIIQSFQLLIPDVGETTNALLEKLISLQTNSNQDTSPRAHSPSSIQVTWVNGLWFAALACSLSTALISMLAKQWLQAYVANISGSPRQRARLRQLRYMELVAWHVLALINALPLLLHAALLLFFAGIVVLLWSVNQATTFATLFIVAFAYIFYFASIWLPIFYPNCPYQHPISDHLRRWILSYRTSTSKPLAPDDESEEMANAELGRGKSDAVVTHDDKLDACALVWLFTTSTDKDVASAALQAIAGLPRNFSAIHFLRDAGAVQIVEKAFQSCFDKDTTIDLKWHLIDAEGAWLYCKAWMNLTRGTSQQWPMELLDPLWKLQKLKDHADGAAIASCAVALSSIDSHVAQWELLAYLSRYLAGEVQLSPSTLSWILDSMIEGLCQWEMPILVIEKTTIRAVPVLLRLLKHIEDLPTSTVRSAAGLALYIFACGPVKLFEYQSEEQRRESHCKVMLKALSTIADTPERFDVKGELLDVTAQELSRLASPIVLQSHRFTSELKDIARSSLFDLFMAGRVAVGVIPDPALADVLHLLYQLRVTAAHHPGFVTTLVKTLLVSTHQDVISWSVRLLRPLLSECHMAVLQAFTESSGINAVLRAAKSGDIDNRRLQVDSWRTLCAFVNSSTALYLEGKGPTTPGTPGTPAKHQFDSIFESDLFETVCAVIVSRRWWLFEVSGRWVPAFVQLCKLRPHELVWRKLIKVVQDMNEKGKENEGMSEILYQLETIIQRSPKRRTSDLQESSDDDISTHTVTMMEQRLAMRPTSPPQVVILSDGTSTWFEA